MAFDIIGDVHGCYEEFLHLLDKLGYIWHDGKPQHPEGRRLIFLGDITDRGPHSIKMITLVTSLVAHQHALYVPGNHCNKLYRYFLGRNVQIKHGLETTVAEFQLLDPKKQNEISTQFKRLYEASPLYLFLDDKRLIVAHAGIKEAYIGKTNKRVETFVLYGDITGETDERGRPIRKDWAKDYHGEPWIIYGHTPVPKPRQIHRSINIDTGCVFGGALTACRYPEMELISVPSEQPYIAEKFTHFD